MVEPLKCKLKGWISKWLSSILGAKGFINFCRFKQEEVIRSGVHQCALEVANREYSRVGQRAGLRGLSRAGNDPCPARRFEAVSEGGGQKRELSGAETQGLRRSQIRQGPNIGVGKKVEPLERDRILDVLARENLGSNEHWLLIGNGLSCYWQGLPNWIGGWHENAGSQI